MSLKETKEATLQKAFSFYEQGLFEKASSCLKKLLEAEPFYSEARNLLM